jgi:hypothetical protein
MSVARSDPQCSCDLIMTARKVPTCRKDAEMLENSACS